MIKTYDIIGLETVLSNRILRRVLANRTNNIVYNVVYYVVSFLQCRIRYARFNIESNVGIMRCCTWCSDGVRASRLKHTMYTYDGYKRGLMQYKYVRHLAWSSTVTVAQPLSVPVLAESAQAVGALVVRQCKNNIIRDISTNCVSQWDSCLKTTARGASDCYWCVSCKGLSKSVCVLNLNYDSAHFGTIHLLTCAPANACARDLKRRLDDLTPLQGI